MSKKRIIWLFNHTSLRSFEVPLLLEMGYEVYCPKRYEVEFGDYSCSISYEYDASLTIPKQVIDLLNQVNFYKEIDPDIMKLINQYFDIAFCIAYVPVLSSFVTHFLGTIVMHGFGMAGAFTYAEFLYEAGKINLLSRIKRLGNRFWFAPSYDNIAEIEPPILKNRTVFLPIGLKSTALKHTWKGGEKKILFISPKIKTSSYYAKVYTDFKDNFGDLPHQLGGGQPCPVSEDKTVTGFLDENEYNYTMNHLAAMYYHSQEPRHIHYHPLEAIKVGMPLVFMAGGMLDHLGGEKLPGRCKTIKEARYKLIRLLAGDKWLIRRITSTQEVLLESFKKENCRPFWIEGMQRIEESMEKGKKNTYTRKKRIAVIVPEAKTDTYFDFGCLFAKALEQKIKEHHAAAEIIFAYPKDEELEKRNCFALVQDSGITLRNFTSVVKDGQWVEKVLSIAGFPPKKTYNKIEVFHDGMAEFHDCDYAFLMNDKTQSGLPLFLRCPHSTVVHNYIQRYAPGNAGLERDDSGNWIRYDSEKVLVTSEPVRKDMMHDTGVIKGEKKVLLIPMLIKFTQSVGPMRIPYIWENRSGEKILRRQYFLWPSNIYRYGNHKVALKSLLDYYLSGGELDCIITGEDVEKFCPKLSVSSTGQTDDNYVQELREMIKESDKLTEHLYIIGRLPEKEHFFVMQNAAFIFQPGYGDDACVSIIHAAGVGVPAISINYPVVRCIAEGANIKPYYTSISSSVEMTEALKKMEKDYLHCAAKLPCEEQIEKVDYMHKAEELYQIVKKIVPLWEDEA